MGEGVSVADCGCKASERSPPIRPNGFRYLASPSAYQCSSAAPGIYRDEGHVGFVTGSGGRAAFGRTGGLLHGGSGLEPVICASFGSVHMR
jgi:hypothetical protein